jgi:glutamyl-Q tRNA(Asp) synthetase
MICIVLTPHGRNRNSVAEESMIAKVSQKPVFRFAPSPNGALHLGHALSALLNHDLAASLSGRFLLRIEDIDLSRCTPDFEAGIYADLSWLRLSWEEPPRRQSNHFAAYAAALQSLIDRGLVYPAFMTRGEVKARVLAAEAEGEPWPLDPDGTPLYPSDDRLRHPRERQELLASGMKHAWRLDIARALDEVGYPLSWTETGDAERGDISANPLVWGDVVLSRSDAPSSYHLSVVIDDALQGVTHVVRGLDLFHATSIHRLLQALLNLPEPTYHHHRLVLGKDGGKLSKSRRDTGIAELRAAGLLPADIRRLVGL